MVNAQSVEKQLKKLKFNFHSWGRSEARELPNILLEDEEIYEAVNGIYEGGFALLVATNVRVLLVDKKPLNYLTVEDFRFDMISEIDYNHRLFGAHINLSAGSKNLKFTSYNQQRLRKLVHHIQHCIAEGKKTESGQREDQKNHLEQINQQLQAYLLAQHQHQQQLEDRLKSKDGETSATEIPEITLPKPSPELSDFLYAQSLLAQHQASTTKQDTEKVIEANQPKMIEAEVVSNDEPQPQASLPPVSSEQITQGADAHMADLYAEGMNEVFGDKTQKKHEKTAKKVSTSEAVSAKPAESIEASSFKIATAKLPMALRNRRFGRPLFHSHSKSNDVTRKTATDSN